MKVSLTRRLEAWMNATAGNYEGEGLIGFGIGDTKRGSNHYFIDTGNVYKTDFYMELSRNICIKGDQEPWAEVKRFLQRNEKHGRLFPWLLRRGAVIGGLDEWAKEKGVLYVIGDDASLLSLPEIGDTELYVPGQGLCGVEITDMVPLKLGRFSEDFKKLYHELRMHYAHRPHGRHDIRIKM